MQGTNKISAILIGFILLNLCLVSSPTILLADEYKDAKKAYEKGQNEDALRLLIMKLRKDDDHKKAIKLFKIVVNLVVDSHLRAAQEHELLQYWDKAISEYGKLQKIRNDLASIRPIEKVKIDGKKIKRPVEMPEIDVAAKRVNVMNSATEHHYLKAEAFFENSEFGAAITDYKSALNYIKSYKDSEQKISESYYRLAVQSAANKQYRVAAENYRKSFKTIASYKDAPQKAANIYYQLGSFFLSSNNCRKAYDDLQLCQKIVPQFQDVSQKLAKAKQCAYVKIAFLTFENPTGTNLAGMALGDFIFETIKTKVQSNGSEFIQIFDPSFTPKVEDVDYLVSGKLNQVQEKHQGLSKKLVETIYRYPHEITPANRKSKAYRSYEMRDAPMTYFVFEDKRTVKLAGVIKVVQAKTGAIQINHHIAETAKHEIRYAAEYKAAHDISKGNYDPELGQEFNDDIELDQEFVRLINARKELRDVDTLARKMINSIAEQLSYKILSALDKTPFVPDPTNLDLKESITQK